MPGGGTTGGCGPLCCGGATGCAPLCWGGGPCGGGTGWTRVGVARRLPTTRRARRRDPARWLILAEGAIVVRASVIPGPVVARPFATGAALSGRELLRGRAVAARRAWVAGREVAAGGAVVRGRAGAVVAGRRAATRGALAPDRAGVTGWPG